MTESKLKPLVKYKQIFLTNSIGSETHLENVLKGKHNNTDPMPETTLRITNMMVWISIAVLPYSLVMETGSRFILLVKIPQGSA